MKQEEFLNTSFSASMKVKYKDDEYSIRAFDKDEALIGIKRFGIDDEIRWVRCENVEIVK